MKIYISVDMEGCAGIVHREQTNPRGYDYELARRIMTEEANAAIAGAFDAGAEEVVISDSHGGNGMRNILLHEVDERAQIITGSPRFLGQIEGIDQGFDALMLVGYHARHGRSGVLSHTTNGQAIANLWINGRILGEIGLNALVAGHYGIPTVLVTGDDRTTAEAARDCPGCETVTVKWALGRYAARCLHPKVAAAKIRRGAAAALARRKEIKPVITKAPIEVKIQYKESGSAESATRIAGIQLFDDDTVVFIAEDMRAAYAMYSAAVEASLPAWGDWQKG